jgi:hypothetical protein
MIARRPAAAAFAYSTAVLLAACGGTDAPLAPPAPPVAASTPSPTPVPEAALGCNLPPMRDLHTECPRINPQYSDTVRTTILDLTDSRRDLFDFNDVLGTAPFYKVKDRRAYTGAVVDALRKQGYCAVDQLEEIAVKKTNDFNEQYNVWTSGGYIRLPPGGYITTCFPAQF